MKTTVLTAILLFFSANLLAQSCLYCKYRPISDTFICAGTCTAPGGCNGCCKKLELGTVCYVGGCCLWNPQSGGLCYDQTGVSCGNQYSCSRGGAPSDESAPTMASLKNPGTLPFFADAVSKTVLSTVDWITRTDFPQAIGKHSKSFQKAISGFQAIAADNPKQTITEYGFLAFNIVVRHNFPAKVTVSHAGGSDWVIYLDRADTEMEGPHAPTMLEIVGNRWTLVSHQTKHTDDEAEERYVIATGTIQ